MCELINEVIYTVGKILRFMQVSFYLSPIKKSFTVGGGVLSLLKALFKYTGWSTALTEGQISISHTEYVTFLDKQPQWIMCSSSTALYYQIPYCIWHQHCQAYTTFYKQIYNFVPDQYNYLTSSAIGSRTSSPASFLTMYTIV